MGCAWTDGIVKMKRTEPIKKGCTWLFPSAPAIRIATAESVHRALPGYVTYAEFQKAMGRDVKAVALPSKEDVLRVVGQIATGKDFLIRTWMRDVRTAWRNSLEPRFAFRSKERGERYWWCAVRSAKGWNVGTYLLVAADPCGRMVRYAFSSYGKTGDRNRAFYIRFHDAKGRETEERYKKMGELLEGIDKTARSDDNMVCYEDNRDEYVQASRNRDGTFYVEYQLYHMPWQMCCRKMPKRELTRAIRLYCRGGVPAIANEFDWRCCNRPEREPFDLGGLFGQCYRKAIRNGRKPIAETLEAVGVPVAACRRMVVPLFVRNGRPCDWHTSLCYLPKNTPKSVVAAVKVGAAILDGSMTKFAHDVGQAFAHGVGVRRNYKLALYWEQRAWRRGLAKAGVEIRQLKNLVDPRRLAKSADLRIGYERELDAVGLSVAEGRCSVDDAVERLEGIQASCACSDYLGEFAKRDFAAIMKHLSLVWDRVEEQRR